MEATAIQVDNLSKCYRIYNHPRDRLIQAVWGRDRFCNPKRYFEEFWALRQLSFSLAKGQTLGIVGRNGSGKSTLLQLLCKTLEPTSGSVQVNGRIGALLELGSGFNPEFSGLENVFLNAALLGLSKHETERRLDQILAFADIGSFIKQPVKTYSSGMAVRLAFAVQAHIDPDVLVVDEALAVGDELFQKKCYAHLERLKERGTSVLLVTHSCPQIIQHCDQALLLHRGQARMLDQPSRVTTTYQRLMNASDAEWEAAFPEGGLQALQKSPQVSVDQQTKDAPETQLEPMRPWLDPNLLPESTEIYPSHGARITSARIETSSNPGTSANILPFGEPFNLFFNYEADLPIEKVAMACYIASHTGQRITGQHLPESAGPQKGAHLPRIEQGSRWEVRFSFTAGLWPGLYFIGGGILTYAGQERRFIHRVVDFLALRVVEQQAMQMIGACSLKSNDAVITIEK